MGGAKRYMEEMEAQSHLAISIAIDAGSLERCEYCESTVFQGSGDIDAACDLGEQQYDEFEGAFESLEEMKALIKDVIESGDHAGECCFHCDERMNGDD
ncbi:hypothetical protein [Shewanella sp.]|uniref:hypothetical protein n=1 Tax=Shewanella TaxID=22 RepID=UPI001EB6CE13|nr:hypothetical protein [Shewanella sp.]MBZ4679577.1 hypothetical protein [Shewanella sp.]